MTNQEIAKLDEILQKHDYDPTLLIAIMQDIQKEYATGGIVLYCKKTEIK